MAGDRFGFQFAEFGTLQIFRIHFQNAPRQLRFRIFLHNRSFLFRSGVFFAPVVIWLRFLGESPTEVEIGRVILNGR